ncbi:hypothetical protein AB2L27_20015 [Kineococcus sp. LSe6-4]|uniref:Transcriptional regulator n=1 Tax=Kineococcus halophytocola TaxID=3234027 RepID=A0ABV4H9D7_9ACTN
MNAPRIRYQDVVPYDVPPSLDLLTGPTGGHLELPHSVHWGPSRVVDLDDPSELVWGYQAVVREGTVRQQQELLDAAALVRVWRDLILPVRCRALWEDAFPVLTSNASADVAG